MRIAVFHNLAAGGAKRALHGFVEYLSKMGHAIDVFVPSTAEECFLSLKEFAKRVTVLPVRKTIIGSVRSTIQYVPPIRGLGFSLADLEVTQKRLADMINCGDYEVIFVDQDQHTMSPFILRFLEKPSVYYCHQPSRRSESVLIKTLWQSGCYEGLDGLARRIGHWYLRLKIPSIDKRNASSAGYVLSNSCFSREAILRTYRLNSFVCYPGIDTEAFYPMHLPRQNYVLSVGDLRPAKGYEFVIRALGHIDEKTRPKFIIVSAAVVQTWKRYVEQLSTQMGVQLEVRTLISDTELVQLYNQASLFVYAPYLEPFGLAPLEAMACGTPVVAVREGGVRESIPHGEAGILTERDEAMFAGAVAELVSDERRRRHMGERAVEVVQGFWTREHAGKRLLCHLERAINWWGR